MNFPQNDWPNFENYPSPSFPEAVPPPGVDPDVDVQCVSYNPAWASVLMSACSQLCQLSSWIGTDDEKKLAVNRAQNLKNRLQMFGEGCMSCGCPEPMIRINNDGTAEMSTDGGVTWTPATGTDDPRNPVTILPPLVPIEGQNTKCRAANSIVAFFEDAESQYHDSLVAEQTYAQIAGIIIGVLIAAGVIATGGALALIGAGIAAVVTTVSAEDFAAAFTDDIWNDFLCEIYCKMDSNGQLNDAGVRAIQAHAAAYPGVAGQWFNSVLKAMTAGSMNNFGSAGRAGTRDCTECPCELCGNDWTTTSRFGAGGSPLGDIIDMGVDSVTGCWYFTVSSVFDGVDSQVVFMSSGNPDKCCVINPASSFISGSASSVSHVDCGEPLTDYVFGLVPTTPINSIGYASFAPFTVKLIFDC